MLQSFVFEVGIGGRSATLLLREGFVTDEFLDLARSEHRTAQQEQRLDRLKTQLAQHLMSTPAAEVYDIAD